jgi:hypothetical protein
MRVEPVGQDGSFERFFGLLPILMLAGMILYFFFGTTGSSNEPRTDRAFGCYLATNAPPILIDRSGLHVLQEPVLHRRFSLSQTRLGFKLDVKGAPDAYRVGAGYRFSSETAKVGRYWSFYTNVGGKSYGVTDDAALHRFYLYAADDEMISYIRSAEGSCRPA